MEIKVMKNIMLANDKIANENKEFFNNNKILTMNIMGSPGAGKTSIIKKILELFKNEYNQFVVEGDIASSIDAEQIDKMGIPVLQINTNGGCHLDANMIKESIEILKISENSLIYIENVGNLVCPSSFDLGENLRVLIASVPEGHDKPFKYISMFEGVDIIVLSKTDLIPYIDFDYKIFEEGVLALNKKAKIFQVSSKTNNGIDELFQYLKNCKNSII